MNISKIKTVLFLIFTITFIQLNGQEKMKYRTLTAEEERVILNKGTERPFTGKYYNHKEAGTYVCRQCGAALYQSEDKFDSGCGWPSFDDELEGAVKRVPDADGLRTEIVCANCGGHLGHVFPGEGFTTKNTRHCVNSVSMDFIPANQESQDARQEKIETAYFASGCFWGTEHFFSRAKGVKSTTVGYAGGHVREPSYEQVCTGTTGHAETVKVDFDPSLVTFEELARLFFETHDFTQLNRQGPDVGTQYRSVIFYTSEQQKQSAGKLVKILEQKGYDVATGIEAASSFYDAEKYHQEYYRKTGGTPYCHIRRDVF